MKKILLFLIIIFSFQSVYAENLLYCDFVFKRDLRFGDNLSDVLHLQRFLNSTPVGPVAKQGPGSKGKETTKFGVGTRQTLVNLQKRMEKAILAPTGYLDFNTRKLINEFCVEQNKKLEKSKPANPNSPSISLLLSRDSVTFKEGETIKVKALFSERPADFLTSNVSIMGGYILDIRKLDQKTYLIRLKADEGSDRIILQVGADEFVNKDGVKNENASNELILSKEISSTTTTTIDQANSTSTQDLAGTDYSIFPIYSQQELYDFLKNQSISFINSVGLFFSQNVNNFLGNGTYNRVPLNFISIFEDNLTSYVLDLNKQTGLATKLGEKQGGNELYLSKDFLTTKVTGLFNIFKLKEIELLMPSFPSELVYKHKNFEKTTLTQNKLDCRKIVTFDNLNNLYTLFEEGDNYEFYKVKNQDNNFTRLLIYPKIHYQYSSQACFGESEIEPRYFPNGLYCCLDEKCSRLHITTPITFDLDGGRKDIIRSAYTVVPFDKTRSTDYVSINVLSSGTACHLPPAKTPYLRPNPRNNIERDRPSNDGP